MESKFLGSTGLAKFLENLHNVFSKVGHTHTKSQIVDLPTIPSRVGQLTNDSGFVTAEQVTLIIPVDSSLSNSSENPVQNKVINEALLNLSNKKDFVAQSEAPEDTSVVWIDVDDNSSDGISANIPVKGVDYWTESDKNDIVNDILAALGTPVFGRVNNENHIILSGTLPDGAYLLKYEDDKGNILDIGTLTHKSYNNLADITSDEWMAGYRLNSGCNVVAANATYLTNFIPCQEGDIIRIKGLDVCVVRGDYTAANTYFFNEDKITKLAMCQAGNIADPSTGFDGLIVNKGWTLDRENALWTYTVGPENYKYTYGDTSGIRYCRFSGELFSGCTEEDIIITVNQEIS